MQFDGIRRKMRLVAHSPALSKASRGGQGDTIFKMLEIRVEFAQMLVSRKCLSCPVSMLFQNSPKPRLVSKLVPLPLKQVQHLKVTQQEPSWPLAISVTCSTERLVKPEALSPEGTAKITHEQGAQQCVVKTVGSPFELEASKAGRYACSLGRVRLASFWHAGKALDWSPKIFTHCVGTWRVFCGLSLRVRLWLS